MTGDRAKETASADAAAGEAGYEGQAEPSMEDILASIRRILTDDAVKIVRDNVMTFLGLDA